MQAELTEILAKYLVDPVTTVTQGIGMLEAWKSHGGVQKLLLEHFDSLLKEHIKDGSTLLSFLKILAKSEQTDFIIKYSFLLIEKQLFLESLNFIPRQLSLPTFFSSGTDINYHLSGLRSVSFLSSVPFEQFNW